MNLLDNQNIKFYDLKEYNRNNIKVKYRIINNLLYQPIIISTEYINMVPLLIEEYQIDSLNDILKDIKEENNLEYLAMKIIGAVKIVMRGKM